MAGYSGTPLSAKLGLKSGQRLRISAAPGGFAASLGPLSAESRVTPREPFDLGVFFVRSARELETALAGARKRLDPAGALWIGWPKRASGVATNVTEDVVRAAALARGLVDVKVCAIDDTWSGLKLVVPVKARERRRPPARAGGAARGEVRRRPRNLVLTAWPGLWSSPERIGGATYTAKRPEHQSSHVADHLFEPPGLQASRAGRDRPGAGGGGG